MSQTESPAGEPRRPSLAARCFFKNAIVYRLPKGFDLSSAQLEESLAKHPLTECSPLETERRGWVAATPVSDRLVYTVNGQHLIALGTHTKILPASVVREETRKRAALLAEEQGFPVGRKQLRELKANVTTELLAKALVKTQVTRAWIDSVNGWLVVEASGAARAEKLVGALRDALGSFAATLIETEHVPATVMAGWLRAGGATHRFSLDSDLELRALDQTKSAVRYVHHALDGQDIQVHLNAGKTVTRLGVTWNDRVSFVLTNRMEIKRLQFLAVEDEERSAESVEEQYDADLVLMTGGFAALLSDLVEALGGLVGTDEEATE